MLIAVVIIQAVSIATASMILSLLRLPEYIPAATVMIVGLHLLPLSQDKFRINKITGGLLLAWSLGCLLLTARNHIPVAVDLGAACVIVGGVLLRKVGPLTEAVEPDTSKGS